MSDRNKEISQVLVDCIQIDVLINIILEYAWTNSGKYDGYFDTRGYNVRYAVNNGKVYVCEENGYIEVYSINREHIKRIKYADNLGCFGICVDGDQIFVSCYVKILILSYTNKNIIREFDIKNNSDVKSQIDDMLIDNDELYIRRYREIQVYSKADGKFIRSICKDIITKSNTLCYDGQYICVIDNNGYILQIDKITGNCKYRNSCENIQLSLISAYKDNLILGGYIDNKKILRYYDSNNLIKWNEFDISRQISKFDRIIIDNGNLIIGDHSDNKLKIFK